MPLSPKSIIAYIRHAPGPFTHQKLLEDLIEKKDRAAGARGKDRSKKGRNPRKSADTVGETLRALIALGFIEKHRGSIRRSVNFSCSGVIKIDARGKGVLLAPGGEEFLVERENTGFAHSGDEVEAELADYREGLFYAKVAGILSRKRERHVARVESKSRDHIFFRFIDMPGVVEACAPRYRDEPDKGELAVIRLTGKIVNGLQECAVEEAFDAGDEQRDFQRIIVKHSLPSPHPVYDELKSIDRRFLKNESQGRKDYRRLRTVTIDGDNAKDFDDAISFEESGGGYKLYIHIADVSAFVQKGGELDRQASKRGTSFYLGNHVIPMLPELLSNDLCSLREKEDRLTLSVELLFSPAGELLSQHFYRGIIRVSRRLTYTGAHELIESPGDGKWSSLIRPMHRLALLLKDRRMQQGRLDLNLTDPEFIYEGNTLVDLIGAQRLKSHLIIEEFMLSANEAVSKALRERRVPTLYRIHEKISDEKLHSLKRFLQTLGLGLSKSIGTGNAIQDVIDRVRGKEYENVVNFIILKSLMQAYYGVQPMGHFGLGFRDYTHFTSPIRRFPDLVVHRCLKSLMAGASPPYTAEELLNLGETNSTMERVAQSAERDLFRLKSCRLMASRVGERFDAVVSGVSRYGLFVTLMEKPIEGMIPLRFLTDDFYLVNEDDFTVVGRRLGRRFRLGDRVRVKCVSVETDTMRIDFDLA